MSKVIERNLRQDKRALQVLKVLKKNLKIQLELLFIIIVP